MRFEQVKNDLKAAMSAQAPKTSGYDTRAEVVRVEGDNAWVHIPGGVDETPVALTINAQEGDQVQVRVAGGSAWLVGNASAPPTDDRTAIAAGEKAEGARVIAVNASESAEIAKSAAESAVESAATAETAAGEAKQSATNAADYASRALGSLSTVQSAAETLAWITQHGTMTLTTDTEPDPTHVYFIRDNNGDYEVGSYRYSIVAEPVAADMGSYYELSIDESLNNYIGTHLAVTGEGLWVLPAATNSYKMLIATGNGAQYTTAGTYIIDETGGTVGFYGATGLDVFHGLTPIAHLGYGLGTAESGTAYAPFYSFGPRSGAIGNYSVVEGTGVNINGVDYPIVASGFASHAEGAGTEASNMSAHAEGEITKATGPYSHAEGYDTTASYGYAHSEGYKTVASEYASHAEGDTSVASGVHSHAQNYKTIAASRNQTAIGSMNIEDANNHYALIVGNGNDLDGRSNALTVAWSGDVEAAGDITDGSGNTLSDKVDSSALNSLFVSKEYSYSGTVSGDSIASVTGTNMQTSTPTGYTPVGIIYWSTGHNSVVPRSLVANATGSTIFAYLRNLTNSSVSYTLTARVLYIKSSFYTAQ